MLKRIILVPRPRKLINKGVSIIRGEVSTYLKKKPNKQWGPFIRYPREGHNVIVELGYWDPSLHSRTITALSERIKRLRSTLYDPRIYFLKAYGRAYTCYTANFRYQRLDALLPGLAAPGNDCSHTASEIVTNIAEAVHHICVWVLKCHLSHRASVN